jgi:hypothetical protein
MTAVDRVLQEFTAAPEHLFTADELCGLTKYARGTIAVALSALKAQGSVEVEALYPRGRGHGSGAPTAKYRLVTR